MGAQGGFKVGAFLVVWLHNPLIGFCCIVKIDRITDLKSKYAIRTVNSK